MLEFFNLVIKLKKTNDYITIVLTLLSSIFPAFDTAALPKTDLGALVDKKLDGFMTYTLGQYRAQLWAPSTRETSLCESECGRASPGWSGYPSTLPTKRGWQGWFYLLWGKEGLLGDPFALFNFLEELLDRRWMCMKGQEGSIKNCSRESSG